MSTDGQKWERLQSWYSLHTSHGWWQGLQFVPLTSLFSLSWEKTPARVLEDLLPEAVNLLHEAGGSKPTRAGLCRMLGWAAQIPPEDRGTPPFLSYQKCWLQMVPTWVFSQQTELSYPMSWFFPGGNLHPVTGQQGDTNAWKLVLKEDNSESLTPFQRSLWGSAEGSISTISQLPPLSLCPVLLPSLPTHGLPDNTSQHTCCSQISVSKSASCKTKSKGFHEENLCSLIHS